MIRKYKEGDYISIAEIYPRAVHEIGSTVYSQEQCLAWSDTEPNPEHWRKRCAIKQPFVYTLEGRVVGFCELDHDGHIDCTYIDPNYQRRGIASQLVSHAVEAAFQDGNERVYVEASICAKPLFEKLGFTLIEEQTVTIRGVDLKNYRMELKKETGLRGA